jgi:hypothetical protein
MEDQARIETDASHLHSIFIGFILCAYYCCARGHFELGPCELFCQWIYWNTEAQLLKKESQHEKLFDD